jgi:hypothetical protein
VSDDLSFPLMARLGRHSSATVSLLQIGKQTWRR